MSGLPKSYGDSPAASEDAGFGNALERVYEAGQGLIVRRIDLLGEEIAEQVRSAFFSYLAITIGVVVALVGWFIAIAGIVDALDDRFPRFAVEIVTGVLHAGVGAAIAVQARHRTLSKAEGRIPLRDASQPMHRGSLPASSCGSSAYDRRLDHS